MLVLRGDITVMKANVELASDIKGYTGAIHNASFDRFGIKQEAVVLTAAMATQRHPCETQ